MLTLLLPYSVQTLPCALDMAVTHGIFDANREPWRQVAHQGLLTTVQRRYEIVWGGEGPHTNAAWSMQHAECRTALPDALNRQSERRMINRNWYHIYGPYGHKAWTMATLVTIALDEHGTRLILRTSPHRRIVLGMLAQLVFISIFALMVGVPAAPWLPLIFFGPILYIATVIATKVEAARLVALVRQAVEELSSPTA